MFGIRTPTKVTTPSPHATGIEEREGSAPVQPPTPTLTPAVRKSIGELEAAIARSVEGPKKQKPYKNRLTEAAAVQQSAILQLDAARNLKGEIKAAVTSAVRRLYELVKEVDSQTKEGGDRKKEKERGSREVAEKEGDASKTYTEKLEQQIKRLEIENDRMEETRKQLKEDKKALGTGQGNNMVEEIRKELREYRREEEEREKRIEGKIMTYAEAAAIKRSNIETNKDESSKTLNLQRSMHSIIVKSSGPETSGEILERIRSKIDTKNTGLNVDRIRKVKDQRVVIGCTSTTRISEIRDRLKDDQKLTVEEARTKDPLVALRGVISTHTDEEVVSALLNQNKQLFRNMPTEEIKVEVKYRRKTRNPLTDHIILQVSPRIWKELTAAGKVHIDFQRIAVFDQSPLIQCSKCLGYGHGRKHCKETETTCYHCGGTHLKIDCPNYKDGASPTCVNCKKANVTQTSHNPNDPDCPIRKKMDSIARSRVAYC
ncbi:unnamed protein product [Pieris macdunnoughi]|uniref:CCHC-type domain-containing protein n=1 Tax=Pieris macdunnoughi TaxID=345717 RepID=A0A821X793_9NEOP|nr:unnamed protein product [Pieris macdunnoughi]